MPPSYAKQIADIQAHLRQGGVVQITTYTRSTLYDSRHVDCFKLGTDGSPLVRSGRNFVDFRYASVRFGRLTH